jgi:uncharacterized protein YhaN
MEIKEIQVDRFGVFFNKNIKGLSSGLNIIYGPNEFGKTTLLEFIRRMLFGFPRKSSKVNQYKPVNGGQASGILKCVLASQQLISIVREEENKDGPVIRSESVENRGQPYLDSLLGYATKEVFKNLYAFTIDELHDIESLRDEQIKGRIYGAGMGLGEISLREIEQEIDKNCIEIFRPRGRARIGIALSQVNEVEKEIGEAQENLKKFNELTKELVKLDDEKSILIKSIDDLGLRKKLLETKQELFPVVIEILSAVQEVGRIKNIAEFPDNGMSKMSSIQSEKQNLLQKISEEERVYDELKINLNNLVVNGALLNHEGDVLFLQQSLKEIQSITKDEVKIKKESNNINEKIIDGINEMGIDWTERQVVKLELSEVEKKEIQEFYIQLSESRQRETSAKDKHSLHQEHREANKPKPQKPDLPWKEILPYGIIVVGFFGMITGSITFNYYFLGIGFFMVCFGALLRNKFLVKPKPKEEPADNLGITLEKNLKEASEIREAVFRGWHLWLKEKDLNEHLSPLAVEKLNDKASAVKIRMTQREGLDERLSDMTRTVEEVSRRIEKIIPHLKNYIVDSDVYTNIQVIGRHADESRLAREKKQNLEIQSQGVIEKIDKLKNKVTEKNNELLLFLRSVGVEDEKSFIAKNNIGERKKYLDGIIYEKKGYVQSRVGLGNAYEEFVDSVKVSNLEENHQRLEIVSEELRQLNETKDRLLEVIGETRIRVDYLVSSEDMSKKQVELEIGRQEIKEYANQWIVNKVALYMLNKARTKYEKERQPSVIKAAEKIFTHTTQGRYKRIFKPMDSDDILIVDEHERTKGLLEMSRGTREQLYLAMRFGLIDEYEKRSEPLPIIMDDVFVNFDDDRNNQIIDRVKYFAKNRQIVILTCHKRTLEAYSAEGANAVTIT